MLVAMLTALTITGINPAAAETKSNLVKSGYKCVRVSVNFTECTKTDSTTQWCDDKGNCQAKPRKPLLDTKAPSASEAIPQP